jgi:hypothetical protein
MIEAFVIVAEFFVFVFLQTFCQRHHNNILAEVKSREEDDFLFHFIESYKGGKKCFQFLRHGG